MGLREIYLGVVEAGRMAKDVTDELADSAERLTTISAPASFAPPPAGVTGPVGGLAELGEGTGITTGTGGGGGDGGTNRVVGSPFVHALSPAGAPLMREEWLADLCQLTELPGIAGPVYVCGWGIYPSGEGVVASMGAGGTGGASGGGRVGFSRDIVGLGDPGFGRRASSGGGGTGGSPIRTTGAAATASAKPITDRLDGLRSDIQNLGRKLEGDGGAGLRFGGGL